MIKYLLLCFILSAYLFHEGKSCFFLNRFDVHIRSNLPSNSEPLLVHCESKDDDLGNHTLTTDQEFHFHFCERPFTTLFHCHLQWGKKGNSFEAYNAKWHGNPCHGSDCVWVAKTDGIYLGIDKRYDWL